MIVDAVSKVLMIADEEIEAAPAMVAASDTAFITGIAKLEECLIILFDLENLLIVDEKHTIKSAISLEKEEGPCS